MESDMEILYKFEVPYPWKRFLRGILYIVLFCMGLTAFFYYSQFYVRKGHFSSNDVIWFSMTNFVLILIYFVMRYLLIKYDKIKEPIKVIMTENYVYWVKSAVSQTLYLDDIRDVKVILTDRKVKIDVNYEHEKNMSRGWMIQFRIGSEVEKDHYSEFLNEVFMPFKELVKNRIKELNPHVKIEEIDKCKKYR